MSYVVSCGPVVLINCPPQFDERFVASVAHEFDNIFARGQKFACITDTARVISLPDPRVRKALADWMTRPDIQAVQKKLNVGSSTVLANGAMRAVMTALYWLWTPPTPQHAAKDVDDGLTWSIMKLREIDPGLVPDETALRSRVRLAVPRPPSNRPPSPM